MFKKFLILIPIFCVLVFSSCQNTEAPGNIIQREKMITVLINIHKIDALVSERNTKLKGQIEDIYQTVLKKHDVTQEKFNASIDYYSRHTEEFEEMYVEIMKELNNLNKSE